MISSFDGRSSIQLGTLEVMSIIASQTIMINLPLEELLVSVVSVCSEGEWPHVWQCCCRLDVLISYEKTPREQLQVYALLPWWITFRHLPELTIRWVADKSRLASEGRREGPAIENMIRNVGYYRICMRKFVDACGLL